jgi:hypothetical protein
MIMCFTQTFPSPVTRGENLVATLESANKHSWRRHRRCNLSGEAKERQHGHALAKCPRSPHLKQQRPLLPVGGVGTIGFGACCGVLWK